MAQLTKIKMYSLVVSAVPWSPGQQSQYFLFTHHSHLNSWIRKNSENVFHFSPSSAHQKLLLKRGEVEHFKWHTYAPRHWQIYCQKRNLPSLIYITMHCRWMREVFGGWWIAENFTRDSIVNIVKKATANDDNINQHLNQRKIGDTNSKQIPQP